MLGKFYFLQVNYIIVLRKFDFKYVDYIIQLGKFELQVDYTEDYIIELEKFREINITNIGIMNGRIETITCESDSCVRFTSFKQEATSKAIYQNAKEFYLEMQEVYICTIHSQITVNPNGIYRKSTES